MGNRPIKKFLWIIPTIRKVNFFSLTIDVTNINGIELIHVNVQLKNADNVSLIVKYLTIRIFTNTNIGIIRFDSVIIKSYIEFIIFNS